MPSEIVGFDAKRYEAKLPDGAEAGMILLTVLVKRVEGTHKAYAAIVPDVSRADHAYDSFKGWVQANGSPLRYMQAVQIWPGMTQEEYAL